MNLWIEAAEAAGREWLAESDVRAQGQAVATAAAGEGDARLRHRLPPLLQNHPGAQRSSGFYHFVNLRFSVRFHVNPNAFVNRTAIPRGRSGRGGAVPVDSQEELRIHPEHFAQVARLCRADRSFAAQCFA
jgi:hypothetical protein